MIGNADNTIERYELLGELATGGMATVYLGRQKGALGFSRVVANSAPDFSAIASLK